MKQFLVLLVFDSGIRISSTASCIVLVKLRRVYLKNNYFDIGGLSNLVYIN